MVKPVLHFLIGNREGLFVDACLGAAGHAFHILETLSADSRLIGIDRDPAAVTLARRHLRPYGSRVTIVQSDFRQLAEILADLGATSISGILFDLGLSSIQLDDPARGFSYTVDGPLDMRADQAQEQTAEKIVNEYSAEQLTEIFFKYGEEKHSRRAAACIVEYRSKKRITSTKELADLLRPALAHRHYYRSLARIWMALRIVVNGEISALSAGLAAGVSALEVGGRVVVLAYHSLEDRIAKVSFKEWSRRCNCSPALGPCICGANPLVKVLTSRPVTATAEEMADNSRARPAKLRAAEKIAPGPVTLAHFNIGVEG